MSEARVPAITGHYVKDATRTLELAQRGLLHNSYGRKGLCVAIDVYTRYHEVNFVSLISTDSNVSRLEHTFAQHKIPEVTRADNGPLSMGENSLNTRKIGTFAFIAKLL